MQRLTSAQEREATPQTSSGHPKCRAWSRWREVTPGTQRSAASRLKTPCPREPPEMLGQG